MTDEPITVREAALRLGVHENTIRNWQKRGLIGRSIVLPSGIRRFSRDDIERMRGEMWEQFAPATEIPAETKRPSRATEPCPMGCGGNTDDPYGGPCQACWDETSAESVCPDE